MKLKKQKENQEETETKYKNLMAEFNKIFEQKDEKLNFDNVGLSNEENKKYKKIKKEKSNSENSSSDDDI